MNARLSEAARRDPAIKRKAAFFEDFWRGEGPWPILFSRPHLATGKAYARWNLLEQHADPAKLLDEALGQILPAAADPGDGIPVIRADLGTTLFPSALGLPLHLDPELHPSLAAHLSLEEYARGRGADLNFADSGEIPLARAFYQLAAQRQARGDLPAGILPYVPDSQGIFDLSHLAVGTDIFYAFGEDEELLRSAQERSLGLWMEGTRYFKALLGEDDRSMIHGHGMPSGVWFPDTGARISEDSCTLISPADIERLCLPYIERAIRPFGRGFLHFCGRHPDFLGMTAGHPLISTLNLGNPKSYELAEIFQACGRGGTVYFGHLPRHPGEPPETWIERIAEEALRASCRVILVAPPDLPDPAGAARLWHRLTDS